MISVIWNRPSVIDGRIRDFSPEAVSSPVVHQPIATVSPRPNEGSQPSRTANTRISRMPMRNVGSDTPISDTARKNCDSHELRFSAVYTPIGMPAASESSAATHESSSVAGSRSTKSVDTGRAWRRLSPKSPWTARARKSAYWT